MHHYYDDLKLSGLANNIWRTAYVIPLLVNLTLYSFYPFLLNETVVNALNLLPPLAGIALLFRRDFYTIPVYYCALNIIVTGLLYASITDHRHIWLFLILGHYMLWYIKMGYKFMRTDRPKYTRFVTECITLNILVFLAWLASTEFQNSLAVIHTMFFQPQSFWVWTLMHYIYTIRIIDYLNLSPRRNKLQRT